MRVMCGHTQLAFSATKVATLIRDDRVQLELL